MADGRRKRGTSKHAGVVIVARQRASGTSWLGRFVDPDTLKRTEETIPEGQAATEEQRAAWAKRKVDELSDRRRALEKGAPRKTGGTLEEAVASYFTDHAGLRARTLTAYRVATDELMAFTAERRIVAADELRPESLTAFRAWVLSRPLKGSRARRSVVTVNQRLRSLRTVLTELRRAGLVTMLSSDAIKDRLRSEKEPESPPDPLSRHDARALLRAVMRHDAARFTVTREENRAGMTRGLTPKHDPVAPLVLTALLSGMRRDELRLLRWDRVDLHHEPKGAIKLRPEDTKTRGGRVVDLKVCPILHELLTGMKLQAGERCYVFGLGAVDKDGNELPRSEEQMKAIRERLEGSYAAPAFSWQRLRETTATYLVNASVFGYDTLRRAPKQLGHSAKVAADRYWDVVNVAPADTLEKALNVEAEARAIVRQAAGEQVPESAMKAASA